MTSAMADLRELEAVFHRRSFPAGSRGFFQEQPDYFIVGAVGEGDVGHGDGFPLPEVSFDSFIAKIRKSEVVALLLFVLLQNIAPFARSSSTIGSRRINTSATASGSVLAKREETTLGPETFVSARRAEKSKSWVTITRFC